MSLGTVLGAIGSLVVGAAVATVTVLGLVGALTGADGQSPANVNQPVIEYGTNN